MAMGALIDRCRDNKQNDNENNKKYQLTDEEKELAKRIKNRMRIAKYRAQMNEERKKLYLAKQRDYQKKYNNKRAIKQMEKIIEESEQ